MPDTDPDGYREVIADWLAARGFDREFNLADKFISDLRKAGYGVYPSTSGDTTPTPWPAAPPAGAPKARELIADALHAAFKGDTNVDLDMLAADAVDALTGASLTVELRWHDGEHGRPDSEGVFVLGRTTKDTTGAAVLFDDLPTDFTDGREDAPAGHNDGTMDDDNEEN